MIGSNNCIRDLETKRQGQNANTQNPYATIAFLKPETHESMVLYFIYRRFVGDIMKGYLMVHIRQVLSLAMGSGSPQHVYLYSGESVAPGVTRNVV